MSSMMDNVAGKGRDIRINTWVILLIGSLLVLGLNVGFASYKAGKLAGGNTSASELQVLSQQLAVRGNEAVAGNAQAFKAFREVKDTIESDVGKLRDTWGGDARAGTAVSAVADRWTQIKPSADQVVQAEEAIMQPFIAGVGPWRGYFAAHEAINP